MQSREFPDNFFGLIISIISLMLLRADLARILGGCRALLNLSGKLESIRWPLPGRL